MASFQSSQCLSAMMVADPSISSIVMNEFGLYYLNMLSKFTINWIRVNSYHKRRGLTPLTTSDRIGPSSPG